MDPVRGPPARPAALLLAACAAALPGRPAGDDGPPAPDEVVLADARRHDPRARGVRRLSFEARAPGFAKRIAESGSFPDVRSVRYRVSWTPAKGFGIEVVGLADGFEVLKGRLRGMLMPSLSFVFPRKLARDAAPYAFKRSAGKDGGVVLKGAARDPRRDVREIELTTGKDGLVERVRTWFPAGTRVTTMEHRRLPWTGGAYVVSKTRSETDLAWRRTVVETEVEYVNVGGLALPGAVRTRTEVVVPGRDGGKAPAAGAPGAGGTESEVLFSAYKVE